MSSSTKSSSKSRPMSLTMKQQHTHDQLGLLESPPDSNNSFFSSPLLDANKTSKKESVISPTQPTPNAALVATVTPSGSSTENSNSGDVYCICRRSAADDENENEDDVMIECDHCKDWLHGRCVNLTQRHMADIEIYICPRCISDTRQTIYKKRKNFHRHDYSDGNAAKKPVQAGTPAFCEHLLNKRKFLDAFEHNVIVDLEDGHELSAKYLNKIGFDKPILIRNKTGLGFTMPSSHEIDLSKIEDIVGGEYQLDVIDVQRQETYRMNINELNEYFKQEPREDKVYNLISFEISKTKLTENITTPAVVQEISWVSNGVWPPDESVESKSSKIPKPEVQKYCLISAARSYTDFHIDFGGSSVWYHVVKGSKIFYLIEPTDENLKAYEHWNMQKNHSEIFLGDRVKECYRFDITAGNTILLPTGWIHAVYTPDDSLVFGGNFLQSFNIPLQIKVYEMEVRLKTPEKYRFPAFETLQWYAAKYYTQQLKDLNSRRVCITLKFYNCLKFLNNTIKKWINSKDYYQTHDYEIPPKINCDKLVKIMSKELSKAEILLKSNGLYKNSKSGLVSDSVKMFADEEKDESQSVNQTEEEKKVEEVVKVESAPKKSRSAAPKEVLQFENMNAFEIKLDPKEEEEEEEEEGEAEGEEEEEEEEEQHVEEKTENKEEEVVAPPPVVVKREEPAAAVGGSLKLKLKVVKSAGDEIVVQVAKPPEQIPTTSTAAVKKTVESIDDLIRKSDNEESNGEDDELIRDLKNSYQDNDFVYPSLKKSSGVSRSKHEKVEENMEEDDGTKKSSRKRKLKPHAAQYLQPPTKQTKKPVEKPAEEKKKPSPKKKNHLEAMIEKNLTPSAKKEEKSGATGGDKDKDKDFEPEDEPLEEEDDEDADFKLKCKNNLKLSKKIKKSQLAKQTIKEKAAKAPNDDVAASLHKQQPSGDKKFKKGFATTKQRLGKLLKLNRCVNI